MLKILSLLFYSLLYVWAAIALVVIVGIIVALARQYPDTPPSAPHDPDLLQGTRASEPVAPAARSAAAP